MKTITKFTCPAFAALALVCFAVLSTAQAVTPPPDGGYPGGNTAEGVNALHDVNTAVGINNTAVGANALTHDTTGQYNVAVGSGALESNTTGDFNMAIGAEALTNNNANFNLAIGFRVGFMNTTGRHLTGIGAAALRNNTTASFNTAIGADALRENTTGEDNTAIGADALSANTRGNNNTAIGYSALKNNTTGSHNTAVGFEALVINSGEFNTATGESALAFNGTGSQNTAGGWGALVSNGSGNSNTAYGANALALNETGNNNIALGNSAGINYGLPCPGLISSTGDPPPCPSSNNICIGNAGVTGESNTIRIGGSQTAAFIAGISGSAVFGNIVLVDGNGQLGTMPSSERFKKDIANIEKASEAILSLRPVTFHYKTDTSGTPQFGLIAEEVEKVNPNLVVRDNEGKPYSVRYDQVNAMLLNEFLKEHRKNEEQEAMIAQQQKQIEALTVGLQKVSAQLEASKPVPQVVKNP